MYQNSEHKRVSPAEILVTTINLSSQEERVSLEAFESSDPLISVLKK